MPHNKLEGAAAALYNSVPTVYRTRDSGDLQQLFAGAGQLLDQIEHSLRQRLADNFIAEPEQGEIPLQDWLIPYFADLFDVRLVSPTAEGRRAEVANAVTWRQGKGSLQTLEAIAESIAGLEVVVHEGWQRVATTPRLNIPLVSARYYGYADDAPDAPPPFAALHPGLPAVTPDIARPSAAIKAEQGPGSQQSTVDDLTHVWRQASRHGAPCHPGAFDDVSRRTVDIRNPDWQNGHHHPANILLYTAPPAGFFQPPITTVLWQPEPGAAFLEHIEIIEQPGLRIYRNRSYGQDDFRPVRIRRLIKLLQQDSGVGPADALSVRFEGLILDNSLELDAGRVEFIDCAVRRVEVHAIDLEEPVIYARNTLFKNLQGARALSRLEYCTVLETCFTEHLQASDCIFLGPLKRDHISAKPPKAGCLRFCALPAATPTGDLRLHACTTETPVFFSARFGERSCAVLHPASSDAVKHAAEDGTEPGCYHDYYLTRLFEAVVEKLDDFLPMGRHAVLIPDPQLLQLP
ncbi:hypothetical protein A8C75_19995 [Marinobacterium aestuarii]|uniref:Phage tail protein n=1 Tax=Marinobacterium aestuarii TaxID=1821621 RepID=A0A1A9F2Y5_9GAMM|nr:hypothetical protein [Marinobacterium aestuarii]ANG64525.1 hypothetical protein A8C75_19995 [Marinobacterium aestuarii]